MTFDKRTIKIICLIIGGAVLLSWLLNHFDLVGNILAFLWGIIFPFMVGLALAYVLNIPMRAIEKLLFRDRPNRAARPVSFILTILLTLGVIALLVFLVGPQLWDTVVTLVERMPGYFTSLERNLQPYLAQLPIQSWIDTLEQNWQQLLEKFGDVLQNGAGNLLGSVVGVATSIVSGVTSFVLGLIFACYLLLDKEHLIAQFKGLLLAFIPKERYDKGMEIAQLANKTYTGFIGGQCLEGVLVFVIYLAILWPTGFSYPLLIAILMGVGAIVPMIGPPIACAIGALLLLVAMDFWRTLAFVIIVIVVQQIEGNWLAPRVVGGAVGLPPIWTMVAVVVGGGLGGIWGMLFFIPLLSVVYVLVHRAARARLAAKGIDSPVSSLPKRADRKRRQKNPKNIQK